MAILSLGLGVGVNTAMFSLVDSLLFRPLPVTSPETLVDVFTTGGDGDEYATSSYADYQDLKAQNTVFTDMIGYSPMMAPLSLGDRSRIALGQVVTSNHFSMLGVQPLLGRLLVPSDDDAGAARVVVLSHRMWQREFGSDPAIAGKSLTLRGLPYTIAGVAPESFTGVVPLLAPELWLPIVHVEEVEPAGITDSVPSPIGTTRLERRGMRWMFIKGRLKPGTTASQAHANVALIGTQLAAANPMTNKDRKIAAIPTEDVRMLVPQAGGVLSIGAAGLMAIVGLVLLIACANVAGMLLARASARRREISVRLAIGASRARLIQQLLVEGLLLGTLGAVAAVAFAWALVRMLVGVQLPLPVDVAVDLRIDWRVMSFAVVVAAVTGLLAGLLPAFKASSPSLTADLRGDSPAGKVAGRRWSLRDALVVSQVALTAVLLVVAGLLLRSLGASQRADVGFEIKGLAAIALDTDMVRYTPERSQEFWRQAQARIKALPGVSSAGLDLADPAVHVQFQPAGNADRQPHLHRGAARRDHRERLDFIRLPRHAGCVGDRRPRHRRDRHLWRAGRRRHQRDHGAQVLAQRIGRRPYLSNREPHPHAHLSHRRRRARPQASRRARAGLAICLLRERAATRPIQLPAGAHATVTPPPCSTACAASCWRWSRAWCSWSAARWSRTSATP